MTKEFPKIKISTWLSATTGMLFLAVAILTVVLVNNVMRQHALVEAEAKARILLDRNLATHTYFSNVLKPNLFQWTAPFRSDDYFDPSWMSSTYAVHEIDRDFQTLSADGYFIRDAAMNARNPDNEADGDEIAFIEQLRTDPNLTTTSYVRTIDGVPTLVYLRAGEVLEESCLRCHSEPSQAPTDLVAHYGAERSFHRESEVGQIISAVSIRIPLAAAYASVNRFSMQLSALLITLLAVLFLAQAWLSQRLLVSPLSVIRDKAQQISTEENRLGEQISMPFGQELREMAIAFNKMSATLRQERDDLEDRVLGRTADLAKANRQLERDIIERKQGEEALRKSEEKYRVLFSEMNDGFALHEIICDPQGNPTDYRYLTINPAFERMTGLKAQETLGKTVLQLLPGTEAYWIDTYGQVVLTGEPASFENYARALDKHFQVNAFRPAPNQFACIFSDITEQKRAAERAFELALEQERVALLTQFVLGISHEFRTPLTIIQSNAYLIGKLADPDKRQSKLAEISKQVAGINRLVELLVEITQIDSGVPFTIQPNDLNQLIAVEATTVQEKVADKGLTLQLAPDPNLPYIAFDSARLSQALHELLKNAIAFTSPGGQITLRTVGNPDTVMVEVQDSGPGISPDALPHIFKRFYREDAAHTTPGFGLGLPMVQAIVEHHGGRVEVENQPGAGCIFRMVLPRPDPAFPAYLPPHDQAEA